MNDREVLSGLDGANPAERGGNSPAAARPSVAGGSSGRSPARSCGSIPTTPAGRPLVALPVLLRRCASRVSRGRGPSDRGAGGALRDPDADRAVRLASARGLPAGVRGGASSTSPTASSPTSLSCPAPATTSPSTTTPSACAHPAGASSPASTWAAPGTARSWPCSRRSRGASRRACSGASRAPPSPSRRPSCADCSARSP